MKKGRPRKPTKLKIIEGTVQKCRMNPNEPHPVPGLPAPPEWLGDRARIEWDRVSEELYELGLLSHIDRAILAGYCQYYQDYSEAVKALKTKGETITSDKGNVIQSPWVGIRNKAFENMSKAASHFGMSPSTRAGVTAAPMEQEENPFAEVGNLKKGKSK